MFNLYNCLLGQNYNENKSKENKSKVSKETKDSNKEYIVIDKNFENNECIICLDSMIVNEKVKILYCGHMYHYDCINAWIKKKKEINCPLCSK